MLKQKIKFILHNIYQHFDTPPAVITVDNMQFYTVSNLAQTLAYSTHFIWSFLFLYLGLWQMAVLQYISILLYVAAINLNRRAFHMSSMFVSIIELCVHQIIASYAIGYQCGFQYFIPVIGIFPFLVPHGNRFVKWSLLMMCIISYLYIEFLIQPHIPIFSLHQGWIYFFKTSNIITAFGMFAMWAIFFTVAVSRSHKMIETERQMKAEAEKAVERAAQQQIIQQEKMNSLTKLTAGVAHEINNPINFVSSSLVALKRDMKDVNEMLDFYDKKLIADNEIQQFKHQLDFDFTRHEITELLQTMEAGINRTSAIVSGLQSFNKLNDMEMRKIAINDCVIEAIKSCSVLITENKIALHQHLVELPEIMGNSTDIVHALKNIITNAIESKNKAEASITIKTCIENSNVIISISDNGKGIPNDIKSKIFDPFFTTKDVGNGTGLGLSITYGIIEKHSGKIQINSEVGIGTEFLIFLPKV